MCLPAGVYGNHKAELAHLETFCIQTQPQGVSSGISLDCCIWTARPFLLGAIEWSLETHWFEYVFQQAG